MTNTLELEKIKFHYVNVKFSFRNRNRLKSFLLSNLKNNDRMVEAINYIFCTDEYLLTMNQHYLNHNTFTDIITFELSANRQPLIADVFISIPRVKENAKHFSTPFDQELHRVVFHGMLHLLGLKDKNKKQALQMRNAEDALLREYIVPRETKAIKD